MAQIYISYSQNNLDAAKKIRDALEGWGHTVWYDDPGVEFSPTLADQLESGLKNAAIVVVLLSPASRESRTVRREAALAKKMGKSIIPVLVEPLPGVSDDSDAKYIDATSNLQAAISRLVKVVDARASAAPSRSTSEVPVAQTDIDDDEDDEEEDEGFTWSPLAILMLVLLVVAVAIALISFSQPGGSGVSSSTLTQVQAAANSQSTAAADARSTADAQSTTIADLQATQVAASLQQTLAVIPSITPPEDAPEIAVTDASGAVLTETTPITDLQTTPTEAVTTSSQPSSDTDSEPTPTYEVFDQGIFSSTQQGSGGGLVTTPTLAAQAQASNLLVNPGFDSFVSFGENQRIGQGWIPWSVTGGNLPAYQLEPTYAPAAPASDRVFDGINAQVMSTEFGTFDAGLYQQVSVAPGTILQFSVYAYVWSTTFDDVETSEEEGDVVVQVGIDPTGGTDPQSPNIIWSAPEEQYDAYNLYAITAISSSDAVTVFIRTNAQLPVRNNAVYIDNGALVPIGQ